MHLSQIQCCHNQSMTIKLNNPGNQSMHLETRLVQLDNAINMELWQEAFKAMEDIHGLFSLSIKPPKPQLLVNYNNKVSTVFWKFGNALLQASTLHCLCHLSREMRKNLTQDEMQKCLLEAFWLLFPYLLLLRKLMFLDSWTWMVL